jgi:hypothetical protein
MTINSCMICGAHGRASQKGQDVSPHTTELVIQVSSVIVVALIGVGGALWGVKKGADATKDATERAIRGALEADRLSRAQAAIDELNRALVEVRLARRAADDVSIDRGWTVLTREALHRAAGYLAGTDQEAVNDLIGAIDRYGVVIDEAAKGRGVRPFWWEPIKPAAEAVVEKAGPAEEPIERAIARLKSETRP